MVCLQILEQIFLTSACIFWNLQRTKKLVCKIYFKKEVGPGIVHSNTSKNHIGGQGLIAKNYFSIAKKCNKSSHSGAFRHRKEINSTDVGWKIRLPNKTKNWKVKRSEILKVDLWDQVRIASVLYSTFVLTQILPTLNWNGKFYNRFFVKDKHWKFDIFS